MGEKASNNLTTKMVGGKDHYNNFSKTLNLFITLEIGGRDNSTFIRGCINFGHGGERDNIGRFPQERVLLKGKHTVFQQTHCVSALAYKLIIWIALHKFTFLSIT